MFLKERADCPFVFVDMFWIFWYVLAWACCCTFSTVFQHIMISNMPIGSEVEIPQPYGFSMQFVTEDAPGGKEDEKASRCS